MKQPSPWYSISYPARYECPLTLRKLTSVTTGKRSSNWSIFWAKVIHVSTLKFSENASLILLCSLDQNLSRKSKEGQVVSLSITALRPYTVSMHSATHCRRPDHRKYSTSPLDLLRSQRNVPLCTLLKTVCLLYSSSEHSSMCLPAVDCIYLLVSHTGSGVKSFKGTGWCSV
jgi:hypothetical protein